MDNDFLPIGTIAVCKKCGNKMYLLVDDCNKKDFVDIKKFYNIQEKRMARKNDSFTCNGCNDNHPIIRYIINKGE